MKIKVKEENQVIFLGDAEDFLEQYEYDEELEIALNELEYPEIKAVRFLGYLGSWRIEKELELIYD